MRRERMSGSGEPILSGEGLKKTYVMGSGTRRKVTRAVDGISLTLRKGDSVGLIGTSGCGKSTTVRMLLGLTKPDEGSVIRQGRIGFVGQDPYASLAPAWTAGRIIAEPLLFSKTCRTYRECREQVRETFELVHLDFDAYENRLPSQLSGGERQRVSIARALIRKPDFLVLDEPTSMLDEEVKHKITDVIQEITASGEFGFLLVTHDIAVASRICGRLLVMESGRIIEEGTAAEVFGSPKEELTKNLVAVATDVRSYWKKYREV